MGFSSMICLLLGRWRLCMPLSHRAKTFVWNGSILTLRDSVVWLLRRLFGHWVLQLVSMQRYVSHNSHTVILRCTARARDGQPYLPIPSSPSDHPLRHTLTCLLLHCAQPFRDFLCPTRGALFTLLLSMVNQSGAIANIVKHK